MILHLYVFLPYLSGIHWQLNIIIKCIDLPIFQMYVMYLYLCECRCVMPRGWHLEHFPQLFSVLLFDRGSLTDLCAHGFRSPEWPKCLMKSSCVCLPELVSQSFRATSGLLFYYYLILLILWEFHIMFSALSPLSSFLHFHHILFQIKTLRWVLPVLNHRLYS